MRKLKYILSLLLAINIIACDTVDFGDTDQNVNGAADPYPAGLLSSSIMSFARQTGRSGLMQPTLYVQYQSQVTYTDEMLYSEVPQSWAGYYTGILPQLNLIINYLSDPDNVTTPILAQGSVGNQVGVATIFKAIVMKRVTDTWGDVPYSEALKGLDNLTPAYDTQESIYKALITDLKAGRNMLNSAEAMPIGDIIYDGNVNMWAKLANSVIMQMAVDLSKRYPGVAEYAAVEFNAAMSDAAGYISTTAEEAWFNFEDKPGFTNPWNANRTRDYFLSKEFTDALNGNAGLNPTSNTTYDSRLEVYADDASADGVPFGYSDGTGADAASVSNDNYWNNTTSLPLMTASYVFLNRAHAAEMGWTAEDPMAMLTSGITASYASLDAHFGTAISADAAAYAAARVADAGVVGNLQVIAEEKWVSLFGQGFDAWTEWRVTGYPMLSPATDFQNNGNIPRRYQYPIEEGSVNETNKNAGISALSPAEDKNTSKVWWDM